MGSNRGRRRKTRTRSLRRKPNPRNQPEGRTRRATGVIRRTSRRRKSICSWGRRAAGMTMRARSARTGEKCKFEHKNAVVNKLNLAVLVDYSNHTCNVCDEKVHITFGWKSMRRRSRRRHHLRVITSGSKRRQIWRLSGSRLRCGADSQPSRCRRRPDSSL